MLKLKETHPLLLPTLSYLAGLVCFHFSPLPYAPFLFSGILLVLLSLVRAGRQGRFIIPLLCLALFSLAFGWLGWQRAAPLPENHIATLADNRYHNMEFAIIQASQPNQYGWQVLAELTQVDGQPAQGGFELRGSHKFTAPMPGQIIRATLRPRPIVSFANPGGVDWVWLRAQEGVYATASFSNKAQTEIIGHFTSPGIIIEKARARWSGLLDSMPAGDARGLIRAITLGQRAEASPQLKNAFAELGIAHLLSISGLHLSMVWGFFFFIFRWLVGRSAKALLYFHAPRLAASLAFVPALAYALLGGASLPTIRALIMAACLVAGLWMNRAYQAAGALCLAALFICLLWPESLFTVSFQLSFGAMCAILLVAAPLARHLKKRLPKWAAGLVAFLAFTLAIEIFIWPLVVHSFHQVPWLSLAANAIFIPLVGFALLVLALAGGFTGMLLPQAGEFILRGAWYVAEAALWLVDFMAALPFAVSYIAGPPPYSVILIYLGWICFFVAAGRKRFALGAVFMLAALVLWLAPGQPDALDNDGLQAWALDVGQGQSVLVKLPDRQTMLVDCGISGNMDPGQRVVAPFLWHMGINRVDILVASHPHPDHYNGLGFILRWFGARELWVNGYEEPGAYRALLELAEKRGVKVRVMRAPYEEHIGNALVKVLWPPPRPPYNKDNDLSLWLGIGHEGNWLWLPGDNGPNVERQIKDFPAGRHLLLAPHHGGKGFAGNELLNALRPQAVVCSTGCMNTYGMPRSDGLRRIALSGAAIYTTGNNGCLTLLADAEGWRLETYLPQPRACTWNYGTSGE